MHRPQLITWTTHTAETTTLLEATRLQKLYTYMCNIVTELVTEFYLYSIVYIYLINSRLDVTHSVRHHFRTIQTLSWCQRVVRISRNRENLTAIESTTTTTMTVNSGRNVHTHSISRGFSRGLLNIQTSSKTICYDHSILET